MDATDAPGVIEPGRLYVVIEARRRLRLGKPAWKKLLSHGLPVIHKGRQAYVFGDDLLRVFREALESPEEAVAQ